MIEFVKDKYGVVWLVLDGKRVGSYVVKPSWASLFDDRPREERGVPDADDVGYSLIGTIESTDEGQARMLLIDYFLRLQGAQGTVG